MVSLFGVLATLAIYLIYASYIQESLRSWKLNQTHDIAAYVLAMVTCIACAWTAWGLTLTPIDWFRVLAYAPGIVLTPFLLLQRRWARPSLGLILGAITPGVISVALFAIALELKLLDRAAILAPVAWTATTLTLVMLCSGAPAQFIRNWRILLTNRLPQVKLSLYFAAVIRYSLWVVYAALLADSMMVFSQVVGAILWGTVLGQSLLAFSLAHYRTKLRIFPDSESD